MGGVLDWALGSTDEAVARSFDDEKGGGIQTGWKETGEAVLDNEHLSIQDTIRGAAQLPYGTNMDDEEFAEYSARKAKEYNSIIAAPGNWFGEATDDTVIDNPVVRGAGNFGDEFVYEQFVEHPVGVAYGTATGSDVTTETPDAASGGYTPGILDSLELIPALKGGKVAGEGAEAAAKAATRTDMGILSKLDDAFRFGRRADDAAADATKAADDAGVGTQVTLDQAFAKTDTVTETADDVPEHLLGTSVPTSADELRDAVDAIPRWQKAAAGGGIAGAIGLEAAGIDLTPGMQPGWSVDKRYPQGGIRVKVQRDNSVLGYFVVANRSGPESWTIVAATPGSGVGTRTINPQNDPDPTYKSRSQADSAWDKYTQKQRDPNTGSPTVDDSTPRRADDSPWGEVSITKTLNYGWNMARQDHRTEDKVRYFIVGRAEGGGVLYISASGTASSSPTTFKTVEKANSAYRSWVEAYQSGSTSTRPDKSQQRPTPSEIAEDANSSLSTGGILSRLKSNPSLAVGVSMAAVAGVYLVFEVLLK
jgi:hypothetical protein